jgi:hypothetical protein
MLKRPLSLSHFRENLLLFFETACKNIEAFDISVKKTWNEICREDKSRKFSCICRTVKTFRCEISRIFNRKLNLSWKFMAFHIFRENITSFVSTLPPASRSGSLRARRPLTAALLAVDVRTGIEMTPMPRMTPRSSSPLVAGEWRLWQADCPLNLKVIRHNLKITIVF